MPAAPPRTGAIGLSRCGVEDDYDTYLAALQAYVEQKYRGAGTKLDRVKATEWHRISLAVLACGGDPTHFGKDADGSDINLIADGVYDRGQDHRYRRTGLERLAVGAYHTGQHEVQHPRRLILHPHGDDQEDTVLPAS